ncbi:type II toxin-antitoxin system CcdA family antitoxin [Pseudophaeobacter sp. EL27]|uniref:type II toxin-antitoxin system CcdA family antitoxin n=1 Tax=Pseudophaeobacter sp. EL27 TaxID=2107580 RepID=UPI000EFCE4F3|nr:type II toxin-antitoxin system CcdA family antitoxin [Pseudophaeobacter sp. EL27]
MGRVEVNLALDADVAETARSLGLNKSRLAEACLGYSDRGYLSSLLRSASSGP